MSAKADTTPQTVIVVVRHPDVANTYSVHGPDVDIIDIDLGSSFDMGQSGPYSRGEAEDAHEYADDLESQVAHLPAGHPARVEVEEMVAEIREWAGPEE